MRELTDPGRTDSYGLGSTVGLTLLVVPLFAIPVYLVGNLVVDVFDNDPTNGELELGLILGVLLPGVTSIILARSWGKLGRLPALGLGVGSSVVSLVVMFVAFYAICSATDCIV